MTRLSRCSILAFLLCCLLPACQSAPETVPDDNGDTGTASETFSLSVSNENNTELDGDEEVVTLWIVSSGSPDYVYAWGGGTVDDGQVTVDLPAETPPREALNSYGLGVALVAVVPEGTVEEGKIDNWGNIDDHILAMSDRHALIYREEGSEVLEWTTAFPLDELSCGAGVEADENSRDFDTFEPVGCSGVEVRFADEYDVINWT